MTAQLSTKRTAPLSSFSYHITLLRTFGIKARLLAGFAALKMQLGFFLSDFHLQIQSLITLITVIDGRRFFFP